MIFGRDWTKTMAKGKWFGALAMTSSLALVSGMALAQTQQVRHLTEAERLVLPIADAPNKAVVNPDVMKSKPEFPLPISAPEGAPNIVLIMTDDVGFGASSAFGGPVPTPNLARLANTGLKYTNFHTTGMCSPSRASLLTGRNHHKVATGSLTNFAGGFPGYTAFMPRTAASVGRILKENGYSTAFIGKHHNVPAGQSSLSGPFDHWPSGFGFEYFFGFLGSTADQWRPILYRNNSFVPDAENSELLDKRFADDAIRWIHNQKAATPEKPFLLYLAPGTAHAPHQAPAAVVEKFKGKFDAGWETIQRETLERQKELGIVPASTNLPAWPKDLPRWESLSEDEKTINRRYMEVFSAMLNYQDEQIGRIFDELDRMGLSDETMIIWIVGDNGSDAAAGFNGVISETGDVFGKPATVKDQLANLPEAGGKHAQWNYSSAWAYAMNTPFRYYKQVGSHFGGVKNGMVLSWPKHITQFGIRDQFQHITDITPTILAAAQVPAPDIVDGVNQISMDGSDLSYAFGNSERETNHPIQYFEMLGNRAIYANGLMASTVPQKMPWNMQGEDSDTDTSQTYKWALYDLTQDVNQTRDISRERPDDLRRLKNIFDSEARKYGVYPIDDRTGYERLSLMSELYGTKRKDFEYWGSDISIPADNGPPIYNRSFTISAEVKDSEQASGVLVASGSEFGGWFFSMDKGRPLITVSLSPLAEDKWELRSPVPVPDGQATITFRFAYDGGGLQKGGVLSIAIDDTDVAQGRVERTARFGAGWETFDVGLDRGAHPSGDSNIRGPFEGHIRKVTISVGDAGARQPAPSLTSREAARN